MLKPSWRLIHFTLSLLSALVLLIAILTGIVLALEPIYADSQLPYSSLDAKSQDVKSLLGLIEEQYEDVFELRRNDHFGFTISTFEGDFDIDIISGEAIEQPYQRPAIFEFALSLHRSLFLKTPGRLTVGIASFFLFLISLSGFMVTIKKIGLKNLFKGFEKTNNHAYFHTYFSRIFIIPIIIIALSGTYLSMVRFQLLDTDKKADLENEIAIERRNDQGIFSNLQLGNIVKIEFPFSDDPEEYFNLYLEDRTIKVSQVDDALYSSLELPSTLKLKALSFNLHTGWASVLWSFVLLLTSCAMLYFIYSGFKISYSRLSKKTRNVFTVNEAEIILLVGSENGQTRLFVNLVFKALCVLNKKVIIQDMNAVKIGSETRELIILSSTYGEGEAPYSASRFIKRIKDIQLDRTIKFSVLGFGSTDYPLYCQFAKDVNLLLSKLDYFKVLTPISFVNKNSYKDFKDWIHSYNLSSKLSLEVPQENEFLKIEQHKFFVDNKWTTDDGTGITFLLELSSKQNRTIKAGDLLSVSPSSKDEARLYSVGKLDNGNLLLVIKLHEFGLCSNFLNDLGIGDYFNASIVANDHFRLNKGKGNILMIANGSGIAPFVGMVYENKARKDLRLIWGIRNSKSLEPIVDIIHPIQKLKKTQLELVYSREGNEKRYVQDFVYEQAEYIKDHLDNGHTIMICGSVKMLKGVLGQIDQIYLDSPTKSSEYFIENAQILSDCY